MSVLTLMQQAEQALQGLASPSSASQTIAIAVAGQQFVAELESLDTLACAVTQFELTSDRLATTDIGQLRQVADRLSQQLSYLLEPIRPIEIDPDQCVVQMRSLPPDRSAGQTTYYELLVRRGGHLSLARYVKQPGQPRQVTPAQLTREVFLRLVRDFSSVA